MVSAVIAVALGAALGALLRFGLGLVLDPLWSGLAAGTLAANLLGGYLVGVAVVLLAQWPGLAPAWRLFVVTGFLGGLTTFSTFSAEVVGALQQGRSGWALATAAAHVLGSLAMTMAGIATAAVWRR